MCILLYIKVRWWIWQHHFPYSIDCFWLHHWHLQAFDNYIVCPSDLRLLITPLVSLHFRPVHSLSFDLQLLISPLVSLHFWPVYGMSFDLQLLITPLVFLHFRPVYGMSFDLQLLITPLVSLHWCMFCRPLFVLLYFSLGHCVVSSSLIYGFCVPKPKGLREENLSFLNNYII
jgi:hypothetical protein